MIEIVKDVINKYTDVFSLSKKPHTINFLKISGRQDRNALVPFACFIDNNDNPNFFVKFPRNPLKPSRISSEFYSLKKVQCILSKEIKSSVPDPFWLNNKPVFSIQRALPGYPMISEINSTNFYSLNKDALSWLSKFHNQTKEKNESNMFIHRRLNEMKNKINSELFLKVEKKLLKNIDQYDLPISQIHGDFNVHNILIYKKRLGIIDWEESAVNLSLIDVFHFITVSSFSVLFKRSDKKLNIEERYERYFLDNTDKVLLQIKDYYGFDMDYDFFISSYIFYLVHMAVNELNRDRYINNFGNWINFLDMFIAK